VAGGEVVQAGGKDELPRDSSEGSGLDIDGAQIEVEDVFVGKVEALVLLEVSTQDFFQVGLGRFFVTQAQERLHVFLLVELHAPVVDLAVEMDGQTRYAQDRFFDENEVAGDETTQFISNIFVKSMGMNIPEPDNFYCPAIMLKARPLEPLEFKVIGASVSEHGEDSVWHNVFDEGMVIGQMNFKPNLLGMDGNYRFYGWLDNRRYLKNKYIQEANSDRGRADKLADDHLSGWGLSFDQEFLVGLRGFARYSQTINDNRAGCRAIGQQSADSLLARNGHHSGCQKNQSRSRQYQCFAKVLSLPWNDDGRSFLSLFFRRTSGACQITWLRIHHFTGWLYRDQ
jgi:hypothetical protein